MSLSPGQRVRNWREIKGISQADLAEAIGWTDYKLCRIETGATELRAAEAEEIAKALEISMGEFYGEINELVASA